MNLTQSEKNLFRLMHDAEQQAMQDMMELPGWTYRDLPRMTPKLMQEFRELLGEKNLKFITFANYPDGTCRGQVMISPEGIERLRNHKEQG